MVIYYYSKEDGDFIREARCRKPNIDVEIAASWWEKELNINARKEEGSNVDKKDWRKREGRKRRWRKDEVNLDG